MIHDCKSLDLEITGFEYHHDRTYTGETIAAYSSISDMQKKEYFDYYKNFLHNVDFEKF